MYGKGVFRAELQPAEVDPRFKIWPPQIAVLRIKDTPPIFGRNLSDENWRSVLVQRLRIFVLARSQDYSRYLLRGFGLVSFSRKLNSFWSQPVMSLQTSQTKIGGSVFDPWHLFFLLHDRFLASLWAATTSKRRVGHPDPIHFVNPKCVRIPCVLAPNNFRVWSVSPKISPFPNFHVPMEKNACVGSILMPLTFHKASSDRHTPSIQGLTKSDDPYLCPPKKRLWGVFLHNN